MAENKSEHYHVYHNPRPVKRMKTEIQKRRWLVFGGKTGWVGAKLVDLLREKYPDEEVFVATSRLENRKDIMAEFDKYKPTNCINAAGLTGRPNVDWCEANTQSTVRVNVMGTLNLLDICWQRGIHVMNCSTGCIYHYDDRIKEGSGDGFTEECKPNFVGSIYSKTKSIVENLIEVGGYDNVLTLRIRMPISDDLHHRSLVTKITKYEKVVNIPNSMTVLTDMLPIAVELARNSYVGKYNFTNPGSISHNEILTMYRDYIDPKFQWKNFTLEEHNTVVVAKRSNNELDSTKLEKVCKDLGLAVLPIHDAMRGCFERMKVNLGK